MLAARAQAIARLKASPAYAHLDETVLLGKLMAYCSRESHSCVEKDAMICFVTLRILEPDEKSVLRGETLQQVRFPQHRWPFKAQASKRNLNKKMTNFASS